MDLTSYRVTGTNNASKQVSVTAYNNLLTAIEDGSNGRNVLEFGAVGDGTTDNNAAIQAAIDSDGEIYIPKSASGFVSSGGLVFPTGTKIRGPGKIIPDLSSGDAHWGVLGTTLNPGGSDVSDISIEGVHFVCATDRDFAHLIRMSNYSQIIDRVRFNFNTVDYTATPSTNKDRWCVAGAGPGTRTNFQFIGNTLRGPMQLVATGVAAGTSKHWTVAFNNIGNGRANPISMLSGGELGYPCTMEDIFIGFNDIWADGTAAAGNGTQLGISIGIDGSGMVDRNVNMRRIYIIGNRIDIADSAEAIADIWIRLGNLCSALPGQVGAPSANGFDSVADEIVIAGNDCHHGITLTQNSVTSAGLSSLTNFVLDGNRMFAGDLILRYLASGASLTGNTLSPSCGIRLGQGNGRIDSVGNRWAWFYPNSTAAAFDFNATNDVFTGRSSGEDTVFVLDAAGATQSATLTNVKIDSSTTGTKRGAIETKGAGAPTITVDTLKSRTTWATSKTIQTTGTISDVATAAARANSTAANVADLVTDFNDLLAKLRAAGLLAT